MFEWFFTRNFTRIENNKTDKDATKTECKSLKTLYLWERQEKTNKDRQTVILIPTMKSLDKKPSDAAKSVKKPAGGEAKKSSVTREQALDLLKKYHKEPFHIQHALTVEGVMRWYAKELGYGAEEEFWGITGLLHDIDFELYPDEHCKKAPELLREGGVGEDMIYAVCSHGFGLCSEEEPKLEMEKVLFAADELTGLIWSCALMRPSKSTMDLEVKSLKKKFKDKKFAAGCSRGHRAGSGNARLGAGRFVQ